MIHQFWNKDKKLNGAIIFMAASTASIASAQTALANQFVYTTGTAALPSSVASTGYLLFSDSKALFDFENVTSPTKPTLYVEKGSGQRGIFIVDNKSSDNLAQNHALNIELYNVPTLSSYCCRAADLPSFLRRT